MVSTDNNWWKGAVIYQIYPRSFFDTNGDGIGDLAGITKKLEYIASLGVDGIWISPFFKSPMRDFGYDVSDYRDIDPIFGSIGDFDALLEKAHSLSIKIIIDLVLSHTSDMHPWFCDESKKDWYIWKDPKYDKEGNKTPPNNWASVFGGSAWEWSDKYQQYYLHNFLKEQPDLNFHNPEVRAEMLDICKFWFDRGVDGLRLDTVNFYFHDRKLRDNPPRKYGSKYATQLEKETPYSSQQHIYDKSRPENLGFIEKLRKLADSYPNKVLIGEIGDDDPYKLAQTYTNGDKYLHTTYNPHMMSGTQKTLSEDLIREPIEKFFANKTIRQSCPSWAFSNHDVVRAASRWFKLYKYDKRCSKMLIALLGCLPGTIFLYQGEELGLPETQIPFDLLQDPWAIETYPDWQGRDGCRTPIPWNDSANLGFSTSDKLWLPIPTSHNELHVQAQETNKNSVLTFTKKFIKWRRNQGALTNGNYKFNNTSHSNIIDLTRWDNINETNCIFNLSDKKISYKETIYQPFSFEIDGFEL